MPSSPSSHDELELEDAALLRQHPGEPANIRNVSFPLGTPSFRSAQLSRSRFPAEAPWRARSSSFVAAAQGVIVALNSDPVTGSVVTGALPILVSLGVRARVEDLPPALCRAAGEALGAVMGSSLADAVVMASAALRGGGVVYTADLEDLERLQHHFPSCPKSRQRVR